MDVIELIRRCVDRLEVIGFEGFDVLISHGV